MMASKALSKVLYETYHVHRKFSMQDMMRLTQSYYARTLNYTLPGIVLHTSIHIPLSHTFKYGCKYASMSYGLGKEGTRPINANETPMVTRSFC